MRQCGSTVRDAAIEADVCGLPAHVAGSLYCMGHGCCFFGTWRGAMSRAKVTLLVYEFAVFPARPWIDGQPARHASYCDFRGCSSAPPCRIRPGERMGGTLSLAGGIDTPGQAADPRQVGTLRQDQPPRPRRSCQTIDAHVALAVNGIAAGTAPRARRVAGTSHER